ncbi:MAG: LuxR C-terminal-related transcriptional regulator [Aggregatilineales bacterium]
MLRPIRLTESSPGAVDSLRAIAVADDPLTRAGLAALLSDQPGMTVVGQTTSHDLAGQLPIYEPDAIAWDVGGDPAIAFERLTALEDPPPVIALLAEEAHASDAWLSGARGLFLRTARIERIASALRAVADGLIVIDPALSHRLIAPHGRADAPLSDPLTTRESEVLQWLAKGLPNKVIAQRLIISESTVKFHINSIMSKLGAQSRTDAVVRATRLGLVIL